MVLDTYSYFVAARYFYSLISLVGVLLPIVSTASAHVIVTPNQVGIAATQTFSMAVPSEKDGLTITAVRLLIPAGLQQISPIIQLADLSFRAQSPATAD